MAKKQKYSEDLLLEAVIKFSEIEKHQIRATALAKWCRDNVEGLEEVRDYHFTRGIQEKDLKTGRTIERPKLCTIRMKEINKCRAHYVSTESNVLLTASNIDIFMALPIVTQRQMIAKTRETVDELIKDNRRIVRENDAVEAENKSLKGQIALALDKIDAIHKMQNKLIKQVSYMMKSTDEKMRKQALAEMGIEDGSVDLDTYMKNLQLDISNVMNIDKSLKKYLIEDAGSIEEFEISNDEDALTEDILCGINF